MSPTCCGELLGVIVLVFGFLLLVNWFLGPRRISIWDDDKKQMTSALNDAKRGIYSTSDFDPDAVKYLLERSNKDGPIEKFEFEDVYGDGAGAQRYVQFAVSRRGKWDVEEMEMFRTRCVEIHVLTKEKLPDYIAVKIEKSGVPLK